MSGATQERRESRGDALPAVGALLLVLATTASVEKVMLGSAWRPLLWAAILSALAAAAGSRRLGAGPFTAALVSFVAWAAFTSATQLNVEAGTGSHLSLFSGLWSQGVSDLIQEPAPARPLPGLLLILTTGGWWLTHIVHEFLVRAKRPGLAIMAAATLWMFPLAVPQPPGRTWPQALPFLAAASLALLLEPNTNLVGWNRPAEHHGRLNAPGLALASLVVLIATAAPGLLPGYGNEPWIDVAMPSAARGYQPIVDISRRLHLPEPRDVLRVQADRPLYLRLAGLDTFDGTTWRLGPADERSFSPQDVLPADRTLPPEVEIQERELVEMTVENLSLENVFVPVVYHPLRVEGPAARRMVYSQEGTFIASSDLLDDEPALMPGLTYRVESAVPAPSAAQLRSIRSQEYDSLRYAKWLDLPQSYRTLRDTAEEVIAEAHATTPYDKALALQDFFRDRNRFTYSLNVPVLRDDEALTNFVTNTRTGYCEYFATAMAVMLRLEGLPSRVVVGFRLGEEIGPREYVVTTDDAHAWVEVLFPGYGWIQFEPTPALRDTLVPSQQEAAPDVPIGAQEAHASEAAAPPPEPEEDTLREPEPPQEVASEPQPQPPGVENGGPLASASWRPLRFLLVILTALGALVGLVVLLRRRERHPPSGPKERILATQRQVYAAARGYGVGRRPPETAFEVATRWAAEGRADPSRARRLAELSQAAAFGDELEADAAAEAEQLGELVTASLRASVRRPARVAAPLRAPLTDVFTNGRQAVKGLWGRLTRR
ncbi:MAG: transglutaminaseTgpA domain-containing protein [Nitriliruptorales bacterium]